MIRVTQDNPCPICGHDKWCSFSDDGRWVYCPRTEKPGAQRYGELGYRYPYHGNTPLSRPAYDVTCFREYWHELPDASAARISPFEGIPTEFLIARFGIKHDADRLSWVYPMYNVHGMSGLQFRNEVGGKN
jgi:hypothetical protein